MNFYLFSRNGNKYKHIESYIIIRPLLLLSNRLVCRAGHIFRLFTSEQFFKEASDETILNYVKHSKDQFCESNYDNIKHILDVYNKVVKNKKWTPEVGKIKGLKESAFNDIADFYNNLHNKIIELTYLNDLYDIYCLKKYGFYINYEFMKADSEVVYDNIVLNFIDLLVDNDYTFVFGDILEDNYKYGQITDADTVLNDEMFFSTEVISFPLLHGMTAEQVIHVLSDCDEIANRYCDDCKNLCKNLNNITYGDANMLKTVNDFVTQSFSKVTSKIVNNIYIQKQANSNSPKDIMIVKLGVTSIKHLLEMFIGCNILTELEMQKIINKLGKDFNIRASLKTQNRF